MMRKEFFHLLHNRRSVLLSNLMFRVVKPSPKRLKNVKCAQKVYPYNEVQLELVFNLLKFNLLKEINLSLSQLYKLVF